MKFNYVRIISLIMILSTSTFLATSNAYALLVYEGFLSTNTPDGISGAGDWATNFKISWRIEQQINLSWKYIYHLAKASDGNTIATSHTSLEVSPQATQNDFSNFNGSPIEFGTIDDTGFGAPGSLSSGIRLDFESSEYSFFSTKDPVWGDFFSKGGRASCCGPANERPFNVAWNADFLIADPSAPPQNGLLSNGQGGYIYKILRPDSTEHESTIPEPTTVLLTGLGLIGTTLLKRFK